MPESAGHVTYLGNPEPHEAVTEGGKVVEHVPRSDIGATVTEIHWQPDVVDALEEHSKEIAQALKGGREALLLRLLSSDARTPWEVALKHVATVVAAHAGGGVSWVAGDTKLQAVLASFLGAEQAPKGTADALTLAKGEVEDWEAITAGLHGPTALKMKGGVDVIAAASFGTAAQPAALNFVALTANNEAESAANTVLAGEIATAEGGLIRKQATYAHTNGTSTATLTVTFTANVHDVLPVTVHKFGVFNKATSGGTMGIETKVTEVTFNATEDNSTLTETLTIT